MSTDNCKKFIEEFSINNNLPLKTTWKRTEIYKNNDLTFRKFENKEGDELLLSENLSGLVQLVQLEKNIPIPQEILDSHNSNKLLTELYKLCLNLAPYDENIELDSIFPLSSEAIRKYLLLNDDSYLIRELNNYYPSKDQDLDIGHAVMASLSYEDCGDIDKFKNNFINDTSSDNVGVLYDKENMYLYFLEKEGISFFKAVCGGDWEIPVQFLIYWSDKEKRLKGFFPKGEANIYNTKYNCAYGSEDQKINSSDFPTTQSYDNAINEAEKMSELINNQYDSLSEKSLKKSFKELKNIILNENLKNTMKP